MELISNILLIAGALGAAVYCIVLSRRLKKFNQLESGMGGAIAVLSAQVDEMTKALEKAQTTANTSAEQLRNLTKRAEIGAEKLEIMLASLHDLPAPPQAAPRPAASTPPLEVEEEIPTAADEAESPKRARVVRRRQRESNIEAAE
ncbi:hypothetical protein [Thioclava sp. GXIMD4216]|uniref:Chemotaxis protein n=1 Tax=Thioclava litoralis TaxID=3076557 RepID=A0ABZ1DVB4_9RHOB|nr:hypothetical protein RPE78_08145 [Thioclava sp. FTW29]